MLLETVTPPGFSTDLAAHAAVHLQLAAIRGDQAMSRYDSPCLIAVAAHAAVHLRVVEAGRHRPALHVPRGHADTIHVKCWHTLCEVLAHSL